MTSYRSVEWKTVYLKQGGGREDAKLLVLYVNFSRSYEYENFLLESVVVSKLLIHAGE